MKNFRKICAWIIGISVILDIWLVLALMFSNGFGEAAFSRGMKIIGLPSFVTDYLWIVFPIAIVVLVYIDFNKNKYSNYPKFEKLILIFFTLIFISPWLFSFVAIKLSDQKYVEDKAIREASGRLIQIEGCQFKIFPDNSFQELGSVPGQICRNPVGVWTRAYQKGEIKY